MMLENINAILERVVGFRFQRMFPRRSTLAAKRIFGDQNSGKGIAVAEIGVFEGENARSMFRNLNIKKFYAIDPYISYSVNPEEKELEGVESGKALAKAKKNLEQWGSMFGERNVIMWIKELSEEAINKIKENLDFVYIDGDHRYEYVKKDIELYWFKVRKGGILAGHDFDSMHKGVMNAVIEFCTKNELQLETEKGDWWVVKK